MLIDTHAHLYWPSFGPDLPEVLQRADQNDVHTIINVGVDLETSHQAISLESNLVKLYSSIGIHPDEALDHAVSIQHDVNQLAALAKENKSKVIAIGECGLDYFFQPDETPTPSQLEKIKPSQLDLFKAQIKLAKDLNLPLIIHCRDAWSDIFLAELSGARGVFHTFSGSWQDAKKALDLGFYVSFSCIITYPKNEVLRQIIKDLPLDKILTETDCPFLPPQQIRGQRNEPMFIAEVIKTISQIKSLSSEEVVTQIYQNAEQLFKLSK